MILNHFITPLFNDVLRNKSKITKHFYITYVFLILKGTSVTILKNVRNGHKNELFYYKLLFAFYFIFFYG